MTRELTGARQANASGTNCHIDDVCVTNTHNYKWTEIVDDEMDTFPHGKDVIRILTRRIAFDR